MLRCLVAMVVLWTVFLGVATAQQAGEGNPTAQDERPQPSLTRDSTVSLQQTQEQSSAQQEQLRSLTAMLILVVVVLGFLLMLMVVSLRLARRRLFGGRGRGLETKTLEDLWLKIRTEGLPDVDIGKLMSEDEPEGHSPKAEGPQT